MSQSLSELAATWLLRACAAVSGGLVVLIVLFLAGEAWPMLTSIGLPRLVTDRGWYPADPAAPEFNLLPAVLGTALTTLGATLLAAPTAVLAVVWLHYFAPPLVAAPFRRLLELLAGIPSVVFGLWGLTVLSPWFIGAGLGGPSLLLAAVVLALMILPTIALLADAALAAAPHKQLLAAAALGLSRWRTIWHVALPSAAPGIASAVLLGIARALGETMAVVMVAGNVAEFPRSLTDPVRTLTANIALELPYAVGAHRPVLYLSGLLVIVLTALLVLRAGPTSEAAHD